MKLIEKDGVEAFLELAGYVGSVKNNVSLYNYACKNKDTLAVTNGKEFFMLFDKALENTEDGVFELATSKAYKKLAKKATIDVDDFPETNFLVKANFSSALPITKSQAEKMLIAYTFVSTDDTRQYIEGVHFDEPYIVATDGRQLYASDGFSGFPNVTLPHTKVLDAILKKGENINFAIYEKYALFEFNYCGNTFKYAMQTIDGRFPNWKNVVPERHTNLIKMESSQYPVYKLTAPNINEWNNIHAIYKKLGKAVRDYAKIAIYPKENSVVEVKNMYDDMVLGEMKWHGFKNEYFDEEHNTLYINEGFFNHALTILPVHFIAYTDFIHAIVFNYIDNSFALVMPMVKQ